MEGVVGAVRRKRFLQWGDASHRFANEIMGDHHLSAVCGLRRHRLSPWSSTLPLPRETMKEALLHHRLRTFTSSRTVSNGGGIALSELGQSNQREDQREQQHLSSTADLTLQPVGVLTLQSVLYLLAPTQFLHYNLDHPDELVSTVVRIVRQYSTSCKGAPRLCHRQRRSCLHLTQWTRLTPRLVPHSTINVRRTSCKVHSRTSATTGR